MSSVPTGTSYEQAFRSHLDALRTSRAFAAYEQVRAEVFRLLERSDRDSGDASTPSAYWREELANFDYMLDASPLVVAKLRQHTFHVTGLRAYDYRTNKDERARNLEARLALLLEAAGGPELLVPEARDLGGFGFEVRDELYNVDTLKYFEALIALEQAGALAPFRAGDSRAVALEIGPGWGGFAYQFKRLFPASTYVLVDFPETFLFSAVYLMTLFPEAHVAFFDPGEEAPLADADFVFVANQDIGRFETSADLAVNMVSFQEMTDEQVALYVSRLHERRCPILYSLNRDRSLYNQELDSVREIVSQWYSLEEITVLPTDYTKTLKAPKPASPQEKPKSKPPREYALPYRHVVGRRRGDAFT
jgi:putative sugar O-methyltransferase